MITVKIIHTRTGTPRSYYSVVCQYLRENGGYCDGCTNGGEVYF